MKRSTSLAKVSRGFLPRNSEALNVLRHIRDEDFRFAITYHRKLRSKLTEVKSELDEIPGIGEKENKGKVAR